MTREEKTTIINTLAEKLNSFPHYYVADISALNAEKTAALRRKCFENGVKLTVVKNTLFIKALEQVGKAEDDIVKILEGSSSVMFAENGKAPAIVIKEFRKGSDKPILKAAYVQECVYIGDSHVETLTKIKSRDELIGDVIALLQSPARNVISALTASAGGKVAGLVKALEKRA
jgi:large subunit ribosomal protein L10